MNTVVKGNKTKSPHSFLQREYLRARAVTYRALNHTPSSALPLLPATACEGSRLPLGLSQLKLALNAKSDPKDLALNCTSLHTISLATICQRCSRRLKEVSLCNNFRQLLVTDPVTVFTNGFPLTPGVFSMTLLLSLSQCHHHRSW